MNFLRRIYNSVTYSKPWYTVWELKYKIAFKYIYWLLKRNGITAPPGKDPLWYFLLGDLTDASHNAPDGIAIKDLYLFNNSLFKLRGFSLICLTKNDEQIKKFCDVNAREAYYILGGLIQLPIINASDWNAEYQHEKNQLTRTLHENGYTFWREIKKSCQNLRATWQPAKNVPFNVGMQAFSILGAVLFSLESLPDEIFPIIEKFEQIWGNPHRFSAAELRKNVEDFQKISEKLHQERKKTTMPKKDLLDCLYQNQKLKTAHLDSSENIDIAAYFAFFENMSKAMIGLFTLVFSRKKWLMKIAVERKRLKAELKKENLSVDSEEGFNYIINHSEIFDRFYMEVLRFWSVAPVLPRINTNVISNQILGWGDDMRISEEYSLPTLSLAIVPQYAISRSEQWSDADTFNPFRDEYRFEKKENGKYQSVGKKPLIQGAENSFRKCPAKEMTRKYFYSMMWWFPKYNKFHLTKQELKDMANSLSSDAFYRPLTTNKTQHVFGKLESKKVTLKN